MQSHAVPCRPPATLSQHCGQVAGPGHSRGAPPCWSAQPRERPGPAPPPPASLREALRAGRADADAMDDAIVRSARRRPPEEGERPLSSFARKRATADRQAPLPSVRGFAPASVRRQAASIHPSPRVAVMASAFAHAPASPDDLPAGKRPTWRSRTWSSCLLRRPECGSSLLPKAGGKWGLRKQAALSR